MAAVLAIAADVLESSRLHSDGFQFESSQLVLHRLHNDNVGHPSATEDGRLADLVSNLALQEPDFAHVVAVYCAQAGLSRLLPPECADEFSGSLVGSTDAFSGTVRESPEGWIIDGKWHFCSGARYADYFALRVNSAPARTGQVARCFFVSKECFFDRQPQQLIGLKASGIERLEVRQLCVPHRYAVQFTYVGAPSSLSDGLSRGLTSWMSGVARRFLRQSSAQALTHHRRAWRGYRDLPEDLERELLESCAENLTLAGRAPLDTQNPWLPLLSRAVSVRRTLAAVDAIFLELGGDVVRADSEIQRTWLNLHTLQKHALLDVQALLAVSQGDGGDSFD